MEPLSQQAFELWRGEHDKKIDLAVQFIQAQTPINLKTAERVAALEVKQQDYEESVGRRSTWISGIVAAIIGGAAGWWAR